MREYSFEIFNFPHFNHLSNDWANQVFYETHHRAKTVNDLHPSELAAHNQYLEIVEIVDTISNATNPVYIRFNNGARKGSIAKIVSTGNLFHCSSTCRTYRPIYGSKMTVAWDNGKQWTFCFDKQFNTRTLKNTIPSSNFHDFLVGYSGNSIYQFNKIPPSIKLIPEIFDYRNNPINIGTWVMNHQFLIGKVTRISKNGTIWFRPIVDQYNNRLNEVRCDPSTVMVVDMDDNVELTANIVDYNFTGFGINAGIKVSFKD